ncbi:MAG: Prolyl-tRNA synthetase [Polyangiaceae bacterium]|jgi:prolyl-tRNA synthetase|nr:Prolyl-tRNA synthetase [Polyangiaceae bacterium]
MRYARALIPTLKEAPAEATSVSHVLLLRGGYARKVGAGIYSYLPLGLRVLRKVEAIVREELDREGALELLLPTLLPAEYFQETGRWDQYGDVLLRLQDRKGGDYHLGPTHEEIITDLARREIRSYRDLPKNLYQVQTKFRDEPRPRGGLLRGREFIMKDAYSFDVDEAHALQSYQAMRAAYERIFTRLGLKFRIVSADGGSIGGSRSEEFQVLVQSGEDELAACLQCPYAANLEVATTPPYPRRGPPLSELAPREKLHTPGHGSIDDVAAFTGLPVTSFLKSLLYVAGEQTVMAVVRGDHVVSEAKLARVLGVSEVKLASAEQVRAATSAAVGFAGPVGFAGKLIVDRDAASVSDGVTGANETDYHFVHVAHGRDFEGQVADLRCVVDGDLCPECGASLGTYRGIEAGHIFLLGTRYSEAMNATYLDEKGAERPLVMGCYGIGISRLVATILEQHHDADGMIWPFSVAPYAVHLVQLGNEPVVQQAVAELEQALERAGLEVLVDDRDERPGVKFKDADLLGMPLRLTVGKKSLESGGVEMKLRRQPGKDSTQVVALASAAGHVFELVQQALREASPSEAA